MFRIIYQSVLVIHVFLGIMWAGGILFVGWAVFPVTTKMDYASRQNFLISLMKWVHHRFAYIGVGVILTGVLLGSVLGPVRSVGTVLHTSYGQHLLTALLVGLFTLLWGVLISYRYSMSVLTKDTFWGMAEEGYPRLLNQAMRRVMVVSAVEVGGFVGLLALMLSF